MVVYGSLMFKPLWAKFFIKLSHLLLCLSSAVNIIIYSYKVCTLLLKQILNPLFQDFQFRAALMKNCPDVCSSRRCQSGDNNYIQFSSLSVFYALPSRLKYLKAFILISLCRRTPVKTRNSYWKFTNRHIQRFVLKNP